MFFCFADLFEGNFIFTNKGNLYIVDFHHASFLPTSFMTYALDHRRPVCAAIRDKFTLPQNNLAAMRVARYYFMMSWRKVGVYLLKHFVLRLTVLAKGLDVDIEELKAKRQSGKERYATGVGWPKELSTAQATVQ
jgi:hypothetical protein